MANTHASTAQAPTFNNGDQDTAWIDCNEGRGDAGSVNASRVALGLAPLAQSAAALEPGFVPGLPMEVYQADPCPTPALSNGLIKPLLTHSPYHAWLQHPRLNPRFVRKEAGIFDLGSASHGMLLEGVDRCEVIEAEDWRTNAAKALREKARAEGKTPLLRAQYDAAEAMRERAIEFVAQTEFAGIFDNGSPEVSMFWREPAGIWVKARLDFLSADRRLVLDYKSTALTPAKWKRAMPENGYDTQSVLYQRGMSVLGCPGARFVFLVQETTEPYACWLVEPTESMRELAGMKIARAVTLWAQCLRDQCWPAYPFTVQPADAPGWALAEEESMQ